MGVPAFRRPVGRLTNAKGSAIATRVASGAEAFAVAGVCLIRPAPKDYEVQCHISPCPVDCH